MVKYSKKTYYFWAGLLLAQFIIFLIFSKIDSIISINENFFDAQKNLHQKLFSSFPFSVGDLFYMILGITGIYFIIKIFKKSTREKNAVKLLVLVNILYFTYQIFWGLLYFQKPLLEKFPGKDPELEEVKSLALQFLEKCKKDRELVMEDRNGVFKINDIKKIKEEILKNQTALPKFITQKKENLVDSFKPSLFQKVMSFTGIYGYYNPFTSEAQYNPEIPSSQLPYTLAHESAHQLGFAREQEASFIGYLIAKNSENFDLKYSADYYALKSLLNALSDKNPEFVKKVISNYSEGMKRDRLYERSFRTRHEGFLSSIFEVTNDLFLKSNQQEGSITYFYFVDLLLRYETRYPNLQF